MLFLDLYRIQYYTKSCKCYMYLRIFQQYNGVSMLCYWVCCKNMVEFTVSFDQFSLIKMPSFELTNSMLTMHKHNQVFTTNHYHLSLFNIGCKNASFYGSNCNTPCPTNCKDSTCHILSGACFRCKPGWTGTYCNSSNMTQFIISKFNFFFFF